MAIAKPGYPATTVVTGVCIKPPYTIKVRSPIFPSDTPPSGYQYLHWLFYIKGTREEDYDPTTQTTASEIPYVRLYADMKPPEEGYLLGVGIDFWEYYAGPGSYVWYTLASGLTLTDHHTLEVEFSGCRVRGAVDGTTYLDTNMFKPALPIFSITFEGTAIDSSGSSVPMPSDWANLAWEIDIIQGIDTSAIFEEVIPVIVSFAVGATVMALLMKALGSATVAIGRA